MDETTLLAKMIEIGSNGFPMWINYLAIAGSCLCAILSAALSLWPKDYVSYWNCRKKRGI